jgi:hypothetical protein
LAPFRNVTDILKWLMDGALKLISLSLSLSTKITQGYLNRYSSNVGHNKNIYIKRNELTWLWHGEFTAEDSYFEHYNSRHVEISSGFTDTP